MFNNNRYLKIVLFIFLISICKTSSIIAQVDEIDEFELDEGRGYFEMRYNDTIYIVEHKDEETIERKSFQRFRMQKFKGGKVDLYSYDVLDEVIDGQILVKYIDGTISDSKLKNDVAYNNSYLIHFNLLKLIIKIRVKENNKLYDISGFKRTNSLLKEFKKLNYLQLNDKFNKTKDIYDGF